MSVKSITAFSFCRYWEISLWNVWTIHDSWNLMSTYCKEFSFTLDLRLFIFSMQFGSSHFSSWSIDFLHTEQNLSSLMTSLIFKYSDSIFENDFGRLCGLGNSNLIIVIKSFLATIDKLYRWAYAMIKYDASFAEISVNSCNLFKKILIK